MSNPNTSTQPVITTKRSISSIWILPLIALCLGGWMVYQDWANRGQLISIHFSTADGIEAGKTKIRVSNVEVGKVESVRLRYPDKGVLIKARIEPEALPLLLENTKFWVVRPRVDTSGVSGLGTLLSGAYIEMAPGDKGTQPEQYTGLEEPPVTSASEPGLRLQLVSDNAHSLSIGDRIIYRGFPVGRIEQVNFDPHAREAIYSVFIQAPYDQLVTKDTRFWNMSGINLNLSADGFNLQTGTLDTLLTGGVTFDVVDGDNRGQKADDGDRFRLFPDYISVKEKPFAYYNEYLLLFDQSVRGLVAGAPVEYRGVRIGTVTRISFQISEFTGDTDPRIPVIIRLEPGRLGLNDEKEVLNEAHVKLRYWVRQGMRASLKSGNLLTGSLYVDFDLYQEEEQANIIEFEGYPVIPTISGGLAQLESKLIAVLDKIGSLKVEPVIAQLDNTLNASETAVKQLTSLLEKTEDLLQSPQTQDLPKDLQNTLQEIRRATQGITPDSKLYIEMIRSLDSLQQTLDQLQPVLKTLDEKPNALIFDSPKETDPIPGSQQ